MTTQRTRTEIALQRMHDDVAAIGRHIRFMEVCGTHTTSAFRCGLHGLMPRNVTLLSGPGCPVCVTAQGDIDPMIELAEQRGVTLCTYGDMLRVPGPSGSLEQARCHGAHVEVVYSTLDAVRYAQQHPLARVVFAAVGFETTAPATAAAVVQAHRLGLTNFSVLVSHKRVVPAMTALLDQWSTGRQTLHGFLCPGHVSVVIGADAFEPVVQRYGVPCVVGGFEPAQMAEALAALTAQVRHGVARLENLYPEAVTPKGNTAAAALIDKVFRVGAMRWRGLGTIPDSGLLLRDRFAAHDAQRVYGLGPHPDQEPAGCRCGEVITGRVRPDQCRLFNHGCTPVHPIGPCMVSGEGTCQAWFKYHRAAPASRRQGTPAQQHKPSNKLRKVVTP